MVNDFVFHEVSEKEREEIKKQAKGILDDFSKQIDKVKDKVGESLIERDEGEREEGEGKCEDIDRKVMFGNAPRKSDDFILGEKGGWN